MPRTKDDGEKGINKVPFSQKQWENFAVYADGHEWSLMFPPQKYTKQELKKWPNLAEMYEYAIAARADYNYHLIELSRTYGEDDEDQYSEALERVHMALEEARKIIFEYEETEKMVNRIVHDLPPVDPPMFPDVYDADERDKADGVRSSKTLEDAEKVWAVHNAPTDDTLARFRKHVFVRPDGRGFINDKFEPEKTAITQPEKPMGEWNPAALFSSVNEDDEEEEEVDLTQVDNSNVTVRRGKKKPPREEEHKHGDGNRKRASEYTPRSASKNKKKKNGKADVDSDDEDDERERLAQLDYARRRHEGADGGDDGGDDDEEDERPEIDENDDEADKTPVNRATPDQLMRELKRRTCPYSARKGDVREEDCDDEEKNFIEQAYVAYRRRAFCRYKPGEMPDPCLEDGDEGDEGDEGDGAAAEEEDEEDSEGSEDSQRPGYDRHGLLIGLRRLADMRRMSGHPSRGGGPPVKKSK